MLFSCVPTEGHFRPMLPLARALVAAGHEVAFATAAGWEPHVAAEGFTTLPAGISNTEATVRMGRDGSDLAGVTPRQRREIVFPRRFGRAHAMAKWSGLLEIARSWGPDAIVYESADLASPLVAAVLGVPAVNHSFGSLVPLSVLELASDMVAPMWRANGLEPEPYAGSFTGPYVDICPPALAWGEPPSERIPIRPCDPEPANPPAWLGPMGAPLIYVTLGTIFNNPALYRPLLDGLGALDGHAAALVTVGRAGDTAAVGPVPERVRVEQYVPQAQVLPSCHVLVGHGGSGTTLGALAHGLPMLLVPKGADQFDNAVRCEEAGAAIVLTPDEVTADAVRDALLCLLDEPSFRSSAERVAAEIAAMPAPSEAAARVVELVQTG